MSTPDAANVRRKLFEALGGTVTRGPWDDVMHGYAWQAAWPGGEDLEWLPAETADEYWQQLATSLTTAVPNWPVDSDAALTLARHVMGADVQLEIISLPDGRVMVFDARAYVLSSLRKMERYKVHSDPAITDFAQAVADAVCRLVLVILDAEAQP